MADKKLAILAKTASIPGKDDIAKSLIQQGLASVDSGDHLTGGAFIIAGGALLIVQDFF